MDYICTEEIRSYADDKLFLVGKTYSFNENLMAKDELGCLRYFNDKDSKKIFDRCFKEIK